MRIRTLLPALLVAAPLWADNPPADPAVPAAVSWTEADALSRKLEAIEKRGQAPSKRRETVTVTESELNSYLNLSLGPQIPPEVSDVQVRLERDRLRASGLVDLDRVKSKVTSLSPLNPLSYLGGRVPVLLLGRLVYREGLGSIEWEDIRVASWSIPPTMLGQMILSATRTAKNPDGFDIHAPFRLPYAVQKVRIEPGRAFLDF